MGVKLHFGKPTHQLYLVMGNNDDGENTDYFVRAETAKEAAELWIAYMAKNWDADQEPTMIRVLPFTMGGPSEVLEWGNFPAVPWDQ